jgi:hypothetical protein
MAFIAALVVLPSMLMMVAPKESGVSPVAKARQSK